MTKRSYKGLVGFSRITGSKRLFMSNLNNSNWISLRVYQAKDEDKDWGEKRVYANSNRPLIDLEISAAQFAELLTTMNVGHGVPCTIRSVDGEQVDCSALQEDEKPIDVGKKFFEKNAQEVTEKVTKRIAKFKKDLEDIKMSKKDKSSVMGILEGFETEVLSNMPFYVSVFQETAKKVVTESKSEIDAFLTSEVVKAGMDALGIKNKLLLDDGEHAVVKSEEC